jgi:hypothetical protein
MPEDIAGCVKSACQGVEGALDPLSSLQVNTPYGSRVMSNATGVLLNNEMGGVQLLRRLLEVLHLNLQCMPSFQGVCGRQYH